MSDLYTCIWCGFKVFNQVLSESEICPICNWQDTNWWLHSPSESAFSYDKNLLEYQEMIQEKIPSEIKEYKKWKKNYFRNPLWKPINKDMLDNTWYYFPEWKFEEFFKKYPEHSVHHREIMKDAQKHNPDEKVHISTYRAC